MINFFVNHIFFLSDLIFLLIWIIFFILVKENRKTMLKIGIAGMILAPFVEAMHFTDWWHPNVIFDAFIRIEDLLFGFSVFGIISAIYVLLSKKEKFKQRFKVSFRYKIFTLFIGLFLLFGLFYIFRVSSFWSSVGALTAVTFFGIFKKGNIRAILLTGFCVLIMVIPGYLLMNHINPELFIKEWYLDNLSGLALYNIPIEELVWFFLAGTAVAALQDLWKEREF